MTDQSFLARMFDATGKATAADFEVLDTIGAKVGMVALDGKLMVWMHGLNGGSGNDELRGGSGRDRIQGGERRDLIEGGAGADRLTSNDGGDTFAYASSADAGDVITDFDGTEGDRLVFYRAGFNNASGILSGATLNTGHTGLFFETSTGLLTFDADGNGRPCGFWWRNCRASPPWPMTTPCSCN